jgi:hypothetical protein
MSSICFSVAPPDSVCATVDAWKSSNRYRTLDKSEARVLMPMYDDEPSLSLEHEHRVSSTDDGAMGGYPDTPQSSSSGHELRDEVVMVSTDGSVEIRKSHEEKSSPLEDEVLDELSPEARALLPAPNSCPRSGASCCIRLCILELNA